MNRRAFAGFAGNCFCFFSFDISLWCRSNQLTDFIHKKRCISRIENNFLGRNLPVDIFVVDLS